MSHPSLTLANYPVRPPTPRSSSSSSRSGTATPWTYVAPSHTVHMEEKNLPRLPPVLQPLRKHETTGRAPPPRRREEPPQGLGWLVVLPGLGVALLSAALATGLFLYLTLRRDGDAPSFAHGFYVDEMTGSGAPLLGLLASTVITNVVWFLGFPVLISMSAYCIAGSWLSYQQRPRSERPNLLTPLQYGLLFKLLSTPGPASVYQVGSYLSNRRTRVPAPAFFTTALLLVSGVLGLTYLISAADIWLHAASTVVVMPAPIPPPPPSDTHDHLSDAPQPAPPNLRSHYPLAPVFTYLLLLYAHALLCSALALWTLALRSPRLSPPPLSHATSTWPAPRVPTALRLAQAHLTDALAPVAARLSGRRSAPAHAAHGQALFVEDVNTARVEVGVWARDGEAWGARRRWEEAGTGADRVFGVYKKVLPYKGEIY